MNMHWKSRCRGLLLAFATVLASLLALTSNAAAVDFSGQRIDLIVPFTAGGGADTWSRLVAPYLAKHLPGSPTIVIRNMPGGGSITGANYFESNANKDGTTIMAASTSLFFTYILKPDDPSIKFDPNKWLTFFASPIGTVMFTSPSSGVTKIEDLTKLGDRVQKVAVASPTGGDIRFLLTLEMLGINSSPVFGLDGGKGHLAFERGEVQINKDTMGAYLKMTQPLVDQGRAFPLFTFGFADEKGKLIPDPTFPKMPTFLDAYRLVHGKDPSGPEFDAWMAFFNVGVMNSKKLVLPQGTPDDVLAAYDAAAKAVAADPEFQAAAREELGVYPQLTGEQARGSMAGTLKMPDASLQWLREWLQRKYNVQL